MLCLQIKEINKARKLGNSNLSLFNTNFEMAISAEINKLTNIQINLEKHLAVVNERLLKFEEYFLPEHYSETEEYQRLLKLAKDEFVHLKCVAHSIQNNMSQEIDFRHLKSEMKSLLENIQSIKSDSSLNVTMLVKEESVIANELILYNEQLREWTKPYNLNMSLNVVSKRKKLIGSRCCKEVLDFSNFVHESGGHENGWTIPDHQLFLKFCSKYKKIDIVASKLHDILPDITEEDVKKHAKWFEKYSMLMEKKNKALKNWRKTKLENSAPLNADVAVVKTNQTLKIENIQEKIEHWKKEKEVKIRCAKEMEYTEKQKIKEMEEMRKQQNEATKKIIQEWKTAKKQLEENEKLEKILSEEKEKRRRAFEANKMIKMYQTQDDIYISKMKEKRCNNKREITIRSKSCNTTKRDPDRIFRPTKQWLNRINVEEQRTMGNMQFIKSITKLGIPEWRKGVHI